MDVSFINVLLERWCLKTHIFHLPFDEATITLQDVIILIGLPVDGDTVTGTDLMLNIPDWQARAFGY